MRPSRTGWVPSSSHAGPPTYVWKCCLEFLGLDLFMMLSLPQEVRGLGTVPLCWKGSSLLLGQGLYMGRLHPATPRIIFMTLPHPKPQDL